MGCCKGKRAAIKPIPRRIKPLLTAPKRKTGNLASCCRKVSVNASPGTTVPIQSTHTVFCNHLESKGLSLPVDLAKGIVWFTVANKRYDLIHTVNLQQCKGKAADLVRALKRNLDQKPLKDIKNLTLGELLSLSIENLSQ